MAPSTTPEVESQFAEWRESQVGAGVKNVEAVRPEGEEPDDE